MVHVQRKEKIKPETSHVFEVMCWPEKTKINKRYALNGKLQKHTNVIKAAVIKYSTLGKFFTEYKSSHYLFATFGETLDMNIPGTISKSEKNVKR